jgi:hypothetical protein
MAFDKFKNYWNMDIKDGVRGEARVQSVSVPTESTSRVDPDNKERIDILREEVKTVDEVMSDGAPGATPGSVTINMGEPQVIDLGAAGIPAGMEDEVREALEAAQQYMGQVSGAEAPTTDDRLERLAKLRESGALSDAEFEAEKARLLE